MQWTEIVGHVENIKMLRYMESSNRMPHSILLSGPSGIGKFMVANVVGVALLCSALESRPCGNCQSCRQMAHGTHPDSVLIRPDGTNIKIEQIRNLQHEVGLAPYIGVRRVCIIDGAELMTVQASNSLLKILEEPAGDVVFILVSANRQMLLTTIISRCMSLSFQPLADEVLTEALIHKGFLPESAAVAARLSRGRMGIALSILEPDGLALRNQSIRIMDHIIEGKMTALWETASALEKMERKDLLTVLAYCTYLLRDILMVLTGQEQQVLFNIDLVDWLKEQASIWSEKGLVESLKAIEEARRSLQANGNARLTSEALLIKIYDLVKEV